MKQFVGFSALAALLLYFVSPGAPQGLSIDEKPFPKPKGPYQVGTENYFWIDSSRDEIFTKDETDKRHLLVQVWYPARNNHDGHFAPYILDPQEFGRPTQQIKELFPVKANAILGAPIAGGKKKFPLVVFSHGMGMTRFSSTFLMEHLASHGFIVFGIGHSFFDGTVVFPDGYRPEQDADPGPVQSGSQDESEKNHLHYVLETFRRDAEFVLAQVERLNMAPGERFHNKIDMSRIGICGWSIGGINAAQMCKKDSRIRAGINFDGLAGGDVVKDGINKPFLVMKSGAEIPENILADENAFLRNSSNDIYRLTISGAVHTNFSDMGLFNSSMAGDIDTKYCFDIINHITLAFFRKYIDMDTNIDIEKAAEQYPEVELEKFDVSSRKNIDRSFARSTAAI